MLSAHWAPRSCALPSPPCFRSPPGARGPRSGAERQARERRGAGPRARSAPGLGLARARPRVRPEVLTEKPQGPRSVVHEPQGHTPSLRERVTLAHAHHPPHARPRTRQTHKPSGGRSQCQRRLSPSRRAPPPPLSTGSGERPAWSPRQAQCQPRAQPPGVQYLCPDRGAGLQGPERWLHDEPRGQPRAPGGAQAAHLRPWARKAEATLHQGNGACGA